MKKVVCVATSIGGRVQQNPGCKVEKGRIYTVVDTFILYDELRYVFLETGKDWGFSTIMFIDLIEDQQDETCFVRDYNKETV